MAGVAVENLGRVTRQTWGWQGSLFGKKWFTGSTLHHGVQSTPTTYAKIRNVFLLLALSIFLVG